MHESGVRTPTKTASPRKKSMGKIEQVKWLAETILKHNEKTSVEKTMSGTDLISEIDKNYSQHGINENTLRQYLSVVANSSDSTINKPDRRRGFYILTEKEINSSSPKEKSVEEESPVIQREKLLYPIFEQWLLGKGVRSAKDTSVNRNHDLGTWGNPDITGITIREVMGNLQDIEITTLEVKQSIENWKYNIFESVAHKRFSNRSYFCFSHPEDLIPKIDDDLRYYAEIYNIGVLILPMEKNDFGELTSSRKKELKKDMFQNYSATDIIEYFSARSDRTHYHFRDRFLKALGIGNVGDLRDWGVLL